MNAKSLKTRVGRLEKGAGLDLLDKYFVFIKTSSPEQTTDEALRQHCRDKGIRLEDVTYAVFIGDFADQQGWVEKRYSEEPLERLKGNREFDEWLSDLLQQIAKQGIVPPGARREVESGPECAELD